MRPPHCQESTAEVFANLEKLTSGGYTGLCLRNPCGERFYLRFTIPEVPISPLSKSRQLLNELSDLISERANSQFLIQYIASRGVNSDGFRFGCEKRSVGVDEQCKAGLAYAWLNTTDWSFTETKFHLVLRPISWFPQYHAFVLKIIDCFSNILYSDEQLETEWWNKFHDLANIAAPKVVDLFSDHHEREKALIEYAHKANLFWKYSEQLMLKSKDAWRPDMF